LVCYSETEGIAAALAEEDQLRDRLDWAEEHLELLTAAEAAGTTVARPRRASGDGEGAAGASGGSKGEGGGGDDGDDGEGDLTVARLTAIIEDLQDRLSLDHVPHTMLDGVKHRLHASELQLLRDKAFLSRLVRSGVVFHNNVRLNLFAQRLLVPGDIVVHLCFNDEALSEEVIDVRAGV
jgi:hypothetical protein